MNGCYGDDSDMTSVRYVLETIPISKIRKGERIRKDYGDITSFAKSIESLGFFICPIIVTPNYSLVDGGRRLAAAQKLGWEEVPVVIIHHDRKEKMIHV